MPALTVGLTGGLGSGKSAVLDLLVGLGAVGIDADAVARDVVAPGTPGFDAVASAFGPGVVTSDGALDRGRLAAVVFADAGERSRLEAIIHPLVRAETRRRIAAAASDAIVVNAVPLLVETGLAGEYDVVVTVQASVAARLDRVLEARGMSDGDARARIAAQASDEERAAIAWWVIVNEGTLDELRAEVARLWAALLVRSGGLGRCSLTAARRDGGRHDLAAGNYVTPRAEAQGVTLQVAPRPSPPTEVGGEPFPVARERRITSCETKR